MKCFKKFVYTNFYDQNWPELTRIWYCNIPYNRVASVRKYHSLDIQWDPNVDKTFNINFFQICRTRFSTFNRSNPHLEYNSKKFRLMWAGWTWLMTYGFMELWTYEVFYILYKIKILARTILAKAQVKHLVKLQALKNYSNTINIIKHINKIKLKVYKGFTPHGSSEIPKLLVIVNLIIVVTTVSHRHLRNADTSCCNSFNFRILKCFHASASSNVF